MSPGAESRDLVIESRLISDNCPFVVAEIGNNHQGDIEIAEQLIAAAAGAGADAVKFQKRDNRTLYSAAEYDAPYPDPDDAYAFGPTYGLHRDALEFDFSQFQHLKAVAESFGLVFFATAFDSPSVDFLARLGMPAIKIGSGQVTSAATLRAAAETGLPLLVSTGGCSLADVQRSTAILDEYQARYAILHCVSLYPCPAARLNLRAIEELRQAYPNTVIGDSNHYDGVRFAETAYHFGARIFEKHFTLSHSMKGRDHPFSLEPAGLASLVKTIRELPIALGTGIKARLPEEVPALRKMGRRDV